MLIVSACIASCSSEPAPAPTLEPVLPPLPSATPLALATPTTPETTPTPVPLGEGNPPPVGGTPSPTCLAGSRVTRLPGLRFGANIAPGDTAIERALDQAHDMNAGWVRITLRWSDLEPQQGAYRWEALDSLTEGARARGLRLLLAITQSPPWATANGASSGSGGMPARPEDFGAFMGALAGHAAGKVAAYEIWRDPNSAAANGGTVAKPGQYVELLKAAHDAIKSADPCALVLNGALLPTPPNAPDAMDDLAFYRAMLAYNGGEARKLYDILAVQLNTSGVLGKGNWSRNDQSQSRGFYGHVYLIRNEMTAADEADKQIWVVQVGYNITGAFAVTPKQQAEYLVGTIDTARKGTPWISAIFVRDLGAAAGEPAGFSLLNPDGTPRPAYTVLRDYYTAARTAQEQAPPIKGTDLVLLWQFRPNPYPKGPLVLGPDDTIYTISGAYVRVLDPNGAFRFMVKPARKHVPGVAVDERRRIYATGDNGALAAYTSGGDFAWSVLTDGTATTPLLISADGQRLYTGTSKEQLDAYATDDGHKLWGAPLGGIPGAPALGGDGTIYVGSSNGELHAVAPDGRTRWSYPASGWVQTTPVVSGTTIYGTTDKGAIFALDPSGAQRWRLELGAEVVGVATGPNSTVYATTADGRLRAIASDGHPRWAIPLGGGRPTAPAVGPDGRIYAGAEDGGLRVVTPDGKIAGTFGLKVPLRIAPLVGRDGAVYVVVGDHKDAVIAFGAASLKERYNAP